MWQNCVCSLTKGERLLHANKLDTWKRRIWVVWDRQKKKKVPPLCTGGPWIHPFRQQQQLKCLLCEGCKRCILHRRECPRVQFNSDNNSHNIMEESGEHKLYGLFQFLRVICLYISSLLSYWTWRRCCKHSQNRFNIDLQAAMWKNSMCFQVMLDLKLNPDYCPWAENTFLLCYIHQNTQFKISLD